MKKQLLLTIALFLSVFSYAQITIEKTSDKSLDEMIKNIDKTDFTSGILIDRSGNYANLTKLNLRKDSKPINYKYFKQALLDLHIASKKNKFISSMALKDGIKKNKTAHHIVDLGIISADYHSLNYNNKDKSVDGLKLNGDVFKSIKNKKPFLSHTSLVVSPLKIAAKGNTITYRFKNEFWFNTSEKTIQRLTMSFENGNDVEIIKDGKIIRNEVQRDYNKTGEKVITFKATYSDMTTLSCTSKIYIIAKDVAARPSNSCIENDFVIADPEEAFQGYDETSAIRGRIDYRIYFRTNNGNTSCNIIKPIIIIDGFDPGDHRRIEDIDCENDPDCAANYINCGTYRPQRHRSIRELMQPTDGSQNLIPKLRSLGYDVIIVNHPTYESGGVTIDGGADFIERNARALTRLIKNVNIRVSNNNSNEQLVIVGPSMGGQISRYALAYMEKKYAETSESEWLHNTRLWISVDSPHIGANIPLGVQTVVNQMNDAGIEAAESFVNDQLGSPAAKQQLIEQYKSIPIGSGAFTVQLPVSDEFDSRTISQGFTYSRGAPFFQTFYNNLFNNGLPNSKGYPQNLRKIALINGSMSGSRDFSSVIPHIPSGTFANHSEKTLELKAFQQLILDSWTMHIASIETFFLPNTGQNSKISRFKKAFNDTSIYMTNTNSRGNMDNVSGGWFNAQEELYYSAECTNPTNAQGSFWNSFGDAFDNIIEGLSALLGGADWQTRKLKSTNSFISSFSAIGHLSPDTNWAQALDKNLVCQGLTPFDSYFGHEKNTQHTSFNEDSVPWLLSELNGNALEPYFPVNPDNLVGASTVCSNVIKTYTFLNCATPGDVVNWSTSSNIQILSSTTNSITIRPPSDSRSAGWIKATFSNGATMQKDLWIGKPSTPSIITGPTTVNTGVFVSYTGLDGQGQTSYNWELPGAYSVVNQFNTFSNQWQYQTNPGRIIAAYTGRGRYAGYVKFSGINICGESDKVRLFVEHGKVKGGNEITPPERSFSNTGLEAIKIYPIPAKGFLNITYKAKNPKEIVSIELFDHYGRLVMHKKMVSNNININTSKLKSGNYIIKITASETTINRKIIIEH